MNTKRLTLRPWNETDREAFILINQDPLVMEHMPSLLSAAETDAFIARIQDHFREHGFGLWAVEVKESGECIGYIGLSAPSFTAHFTPCVEIGWRLSSKHWGKGYATEGAKAVLEHAFKNLGLSEIVSFTVPANVRSIRVMEKIGMQRDFDGDFAHPKLPAEHRLSNHVLYRIKRSL